MPRIDPGQQAFVLEGLVVWAAAEHLARNLKAFTLFATHYFELTQLPDQLPGIYNAHLTASEHDNRIVFLHRVQEGPASRSYGLQVAQLAGVPQSVIHQAGEKLRELEAGKPLAAADPTSTAATPAPAPAQASLFAEPSAVEHALKELDPDDLTPKQALEALYKLRGLL